MNAKMDKLSTTFILYDHIWEAFPKMLTTLCRALATYSLSQIQPTPS
jgi:hypothetical protein